MSDFPDCERISEAVATPRIQTMQWLRWVIKQTIWSPLTSVFGLIGLKLETIQVLVVDIAAGRVLMLATRELSRERTPTLVPVQGLRRWGLLPGMGYGADAREDARREFAEEAVRNPPDIARFEHVRTYAEGRHGQFRCHLFVVKASIDELELIAVTGEGSVCWATPDYVRKTLAKSRTQARSTEMLSAVLDDVFGPENQPIGEQALTQ